MFHGAGGRVQQGKTGGKLVDVSSHKGDHRLNGKVVDLGRFQECEESINNYYLDF